MERLVSFIVKHGYAVNPRLKAREAGIAAFEKDVLNNTNRVQVGDKTGPAYKMKAKDPRIHDGKLEVWVPLTRVNELEQHGQRLKDAGEPLDIILPRPYRKLNEDDFLKAYVYFDRKRHGPLFRQIKDGLVAKARPPDA